MWCFLEDDNLRVDISEAADWFKFAVEQIMDSDIDEDEVPFMLFLCGAEAALRTQEQSDEVLH